MQVIDKKELYKGKNSQLVLVLGRSGMGKSTSLRNFPSEKTFVINIMKKPLPFARNVEWQEGKNQLGTADTSSIIRKMKDIDREGKFEYLIVDDLQYVMMTECMQKAHVAGWDKWTNMAKNIWDIFITATALRGDMKVFFLTHEDDNRQMKSLGKLLKEQLTPEGLGTVTLYNEIMVHEGRKRYLFTTQSDGHTLAKSPMGMLPDPIVNDLFKVALRMDEYYKGIKLADSQIRFDIDEDLTAEEEKSAQKDL